METGGVCFTFYTPTPQCVLFAESGPEFWPEARQLPQHSQGS
jgi:hypothetical protein